MEIQVLSDLHLESPAAYDIFEIPPSSPYLALLGDIGNTNHVDMISFLRKLLYQFRTVFFVLGNHEPYHSSWEKAKTQLKELKKDLDAKRASQATKSVGETPGEFIILDQTRHDISKEVTVLGCTLFSHVTEAQFDYVSYGLNDFYYIEDWSVEKHNLAWKSDVEWLDSQVAEIERREPERRIVILTHHCPSLDTRTVNPRHAASKISSGFSSDLSKNLCMTSQCVKVWAFGHTHFSCDFVCTATDTRIVANQRGYYFAQGEGVNFDPRKTVSI